MKIPLIFPIAFLVIMAFPSPLVQGEKLDGHNSLVFTLRGIKAKTSTTIDATTTSMTDGKTNKEDNASLKGVTSQLSDIRGTQSSGFNSFSNDQGPGSTGTDSFHRHYDPCNAFNYNRGCSSP